MARTLSRTSVEDVPPGGPGARGRALRLGVVAGMAGALAAAGVALTPPTTALAATSPGFPALQPPVVQYFDPPVRIQGNLAVQDQQTSTTLAALGAMETDSSRARLALRLPRTTIGIELVSRARNALETNRKGKPVGTRPEAADFIPLAYVKSPAGTSPAWGVFPAVRATSLAFGVIPAEATIVFSQLRTGVSAASPQGTPVPLKGNLYTKYTETGGQLPLFDATFSGQLDLTVTGLRVDGRSLDIGSGCRASSPLTVSLVGKPSPTGAAVLGTYSATAGGDLYGEVSIPPFSGCRSASGEDLSRLLTSTLSGGTTAIHLRQGNASFTQTECLPSAQACQLVSLGDPGSTPERVPTTPPDYTPRLPPPPLPLLHPADGALTSAVAAASSSAPPRAGR